MWRKPLLATVYLYTAICRARSILQHLNPSVLSCRSCGHRFGRMFIHSTLVLLEPPMTTPVPTCAVGWTYVHSTVVQ
ncbi:uncharacterized protein EI97DRAFT_104770 [Westerdykella ornata]|uniref:Uncharacterized protein n=1 Tax=Westerdykella ornata TaxID=318751 RepID=A0A6A6JXX9_WESOR|nr:uncharacterized protein EI97DRAFT_104770 [Westerdykella ornata]KAF2279889.1 hypothetical protein EI97DRAFT_104770 [Westerdykella ornata]